MAFKFRRKIFLFIFPFLLSFVTISGSNHQLPIIINTWPFSEATKAAWDVLSHPEGTGLDAIVAGCTKCEETQCDGTVGYGGSPDENGDTTLDAMIMNGPTHDVGAVGDLKRVKNAIGVARAVMEYTTETFLVGESATKFAVSLGFPEETLKTNKSIEMYKEWKKHNCQPNYRQNVEPDPRKSCGPYKPIKSHEKLKYIQRFNEHVSDTNHDTIGMVIVDGNGNLYAGTSTNGAAHKIPGRVGDSPIAGSGAYVDNDVGGAAATGDGDTMMRFLPSFQTVENMRHGLSPSNACRDSLKRILRFYPKFSGAIVAVNKTGSVGAACHKISTFHYSVIGRGMKNVKVVPVVCTQ